MRRTKIVCTLGPASNDRDILLEMARQGMDVARFNFSHGEHDEHRHRMSLVREVEKELGKPIGLMLDTQGPEIRTGDLKEGEVELEEGEEIIVTTGDIEGDNEVICVDYENLPGDLEPGSKILIDDGLIELEVLSVAGDEINTKIMNGGSLGTYKGVNLPGVEVKLPALTEKDRKDITFGCEQEVHFVAASFVRKADDVIEIRKLLEEHDSEDINIIPKIENEEGVENIDEIIEVSDGIMVARGDLGVELPAEKVPIIQKQIIDKCNEAAIPVITATQMLDSMIRNPRPTRAEASDVANAIFDGTDAIMLSGESAAGSYPVEAVRTMDRIAVETENSLTYSERLSSLRPAGKTATEAISHASCETAINLEADAIITATDSGLTARMVAKYRPFIKIIAVTPGERVRHFLTLTWGVYPLLSEKAETTDKMIQMSIDAALDEGLIENGDLVTVTAGAPVGVPGTTNLIKVDIVGRPLLEGNGVGKSIVTGRAVIVENANDAKEKINEGDIIVTDITDKDYMPVLEKVAGIITKKGGLTSHPAIVGLNLEKPVVVGIGEQIEKLKDGEEITLDGVRGLVYRGRAHLR